MIMKATFTRSGIHAVVAVVAAVVLSCLASCSDKDEDGNYPRIRSDFFDVLVDKDSMVTHATLDDGKTYAISNVRSLHAMTNDTIIRCHGTLEISADSTMVTIYSVQSITSGMAHTAEEYKERHMPTEQYPVKVVAIYKARSYINLIVNTMVEASLEHALDFMCDSISNRNGCRMLHIHLTHWRRPEEIEAYTQKNYLSLPLGKEFFLDEYKDFDSVEISINTYEGVKKYCF